MGSGGLGANGSDVGNTLLDNLYLKGRAMARAAAPPSLRRALQPVAAEIAIRRAFAGIAEAEPKTLPGPLIVSGLIAESKGVSEGARLTIAGLEAAGYRVTPHDLRKVFNRPGEEWARLPADRPGGVWLMHINAPETVAALAGVEADDWRGRLRIGYWAYELPQAPASWVRAAQLLHEIWTPSRAVANALDAAGVRTPVRVMPHPVSLGPAPGQRRRHRFGLPENALCVLAMGDLMSSAARKNLIGAISIYARAFPEGGTARLVVKTQSSEAFPSFAAEAARAARGRSDIIRMCGSMPGEEVRSLIASCDVVLSPHRSEGFGLVLAEAFLAGVPALATGWSGNLEFMQELPELLIACRLTPVRDPSGVYRGGEGLSWAEPDEADAAAKLQALAASTELRRSLAAKGKHAVEALAGQWSREALAGTPLARFVA